VNQLRSDIDAETETLRQSLTAGADVELRRLDEAGTRLRQHLNDLDTLSARCTEVNSIKGAHRANETNLNKIN